jgi:hypothetical protein
MQPSVALLARLSTLLTLPSPVAVSPASPPPSFRRSTLVFVYHTLGITQQQQQQQQHLSWSFSARAAPRQKAEGSTDPRASSSSPRSIHRPSGCSPPSPAARVLILSAESLSLLGLAGPPEAVHSLFCIWPTGFLRSLAEPVTGDSFALGGCLDDIEPAVGSGSRRALCLLERQGYNRNGNPTRHFGIPSPWGSGVISRLRSLRRSRR